MEATCRQLMLFTEASLNDPAKTSRSPEDRQDLRDREADCGSRCSGSFPNSDPLMFLLKTCVERSISPCLPSSPVWKEKATKCGQASFQLLHLERRTSESDSSCSESGAMWPTPSARDYKGANGEAHFLDKARPHLSQLPNAVRASSGPRRMPHVENGEPSRRTTCSAGWSEECP